MVSPLFATLLLIRVRGGLSSLLLTFHRNAPHILTLSIRSLRGVEEQCCTRKHQRRQSNRNPVSSVKVLQRIIKEKGPGAMWSGCSARMVEGCLSGAVLLSSKEAFRKALTSSPVIRKRFAPATIGFVAGACGGACQAVVMTPCSLLVTAAAAGAGGGNVKVAARDIYERKGLAGLYRGSRAVAARQATNWASRQGFTELVRPRIGIGGIPGEIVA